METLPALKITHFNGEPARGQVYAYLRCYVRDGEIPFSVTVFDETPPDTARFGFAVTPDDAAGTYLYKAAGRCAVAVPYRGTGRRTAAPAGNAAHAASGRQ